MKIVHIISNLNIGGAENFVVQLANEQSKNNEVIVLALRTTDSQYNFINKLEESVGFKQLNWKKKYSITQLLELNKVIKQLTPKALCVHLHNPLYYVYALSFLRPKISYVHTIHSSFNNWKMILGYLNKFKSLNNRILHVCVAPSIYNDLKEHYPKLRSTIIPNGISSHTLSRRKDEIEKFWNNFSITPKKGKRFIAIGNINRHKNYKLIATSFQSLYQKYPDAFCIQIGNEMDLVLTKELRNLNVPNIFLAGGHTNAADFLVEADALLISSVNEGMPIVALEALSLGIPIISTPAGGMKDIVENEYNGFLTKDFESESFTNAIQNFIELPEEDKKDMSSNAKQCFEKKYKIQQVSKTYQTNICRL